jgi:hypothetical protein
MPREDPEYRMSQIRQWQHQYEKFLASGSPKDMPEMPPPFSDEAIALAARLRTEFLITIIKRHARTLRTSSRTGAWIALASAAVLAAALLSEPRSPDVREPDRTVPQTTDDQVAHPTVEEWRGNSGRLRSIDR